MPFWALGLNFSWELLYTLSDIFLQAHGPLTGMTLVQTIANAAWVCLDVVILSTYFLYGKEEWSGVIAKKWFAPWSILGIICCFAQGNDLLISVECLGELIGNIRQRKGWVIAFIH